MHVSANITIIPICLNSNNKNNNTKRYQLARLPNLSYYAIVPIWCLPSL